MGERRRYAPLPSTSLSERATSLVLFFVFLMGCAAILAGAFYGLLLISGGARADEGGHHGLGHADWHEGFYSRLVRPDTKTSCCNLSDCRPTQGRQADDHYEVMVDGAWVPVPPDKVVKESAPDGGYHVCAPAVPKGVLYCVILPPEG